MLSWCNKTCNIFKLKNHAKNEARRLVPDLSLFSKKLYTRQKNQVVSTLFLIHFGRPRVWHIIKTKWSEICSILSLGLASRPHFLYNFSRKIFLMLHSIYWPHFIVWLFLLFEILGIMCIEIICCRVCDVINFEITLSFLIKSFSYMIQKVRTKF